MARDLKDKVVVVTGAAAGIGYAIAENFLINGAKVILLDINSSQGEESTNLLNSKYVNNATFMSCDVTVDLDEVYDKIICKHEYVDVLVNNAGICNEFDAKKTMEVNAMATIEWSVKFYEKMRADKGGKGGTIINISSIYGFKTDPFMMYYKASKFAVYGFSKSLGHNDNYENSRVRVLTICPGLTHTNMAVEVKTWDEHRESFKASLDKADGQTPDDVGKAAVKIFENAASGTAWVVAAGKPPVEV